MTAPRHVALVPARAGSQGIPNKNRLLFDMTIGFIKGLGFISDTIVSSNDEELLGTAAAKGLKTRRRPDALAGSTAPIKPTFDDAVDALAIDPETYLWLFYIPFVFRDPADFHAAHSLVEEKRPSSVMTFLPAKTHPYRCWGQDPATGKMWKFIDNPAVSRQEFPSAWWNHHYICVVRVGALDQLNNNLLGPDTTPIYYTEEQGDRLIELDEMSDLEHWRRVYPEEYARWWRSLPPDCRIGAPPV